MRRVRIALFLVLYRVIPSCHSWGFSPIAPSWGCSKGLKTKKWPELQLFAIMDCRRAQRRKLRPGIAANQLWSSPLPLCRWGKGVRNRKKAARKPKFLFSQRGVVWSCNKSGLSGWSARYFVSRETGCCVRIGFFGAIGTLLGNFERQGCRCSPTSIGEAPFMEGV